MGRLYLSEKFVCFGCHHKIVLMQTFDHMCPPLDGNPSPLQHDKRMMVFLFSGHCDLVRKSNSLNIIFEFEDPLQTLDAVYFDQFPFRELRKKFSDLSIG